MNRWLLYGNTNDKTKILCDQAFSDNLPESADAYAKEILEHLQPDNLDKVLVLCGPGKPGLVGGAVVQRLKASNLEAKICLTPSVGRKDFFDFFPLDLESSQADPESFDSYSVIIDAFSLEKPDLARSLISRLDKTSCPVCSIDFPSKTAESKELLSKGKDRLFVLDYLKPEHLNLIEQLPGGRLIVVETPSAMAASLPDWMKGDRIQAPDQAVRIADQGLISRLLPVRNPGANKGNFGKVLIAAGSRSMSGAAVLAAKACFHSGCGTLTLFSPRSAGFLEASKTNLAMILYAHENEEGFFSPAAAEQLDLLLERFSFFEAGNGIGTGTGAARVVDCLMKSQKPLVLDADGINLLSRNPESLKDRRDIILTPHIKEFSRLTGKSVPEILARPLDAADDFINENPQCVLVLKSSFTLIVSKNGKVLVCRPDPALAKGGSGDVLAGTIAGLAASSNDLFTSAVCGVWIHNQSARYAKSSYSFTPEDLIDHLGDVFASLQ